MMGVDWRFPYPSQRMPVFARNVVATSQPLAAMAGVEMLRAGGNAVDAALAAAIALTVVEPTSNGIGSDAFALIRAGGGLHGLNASGRSPKALPVERFDGLQEVPPRGWEAVTTPGAVSAWVKLSQRFGALPFVKLFEPAVRYAREGFLVSPQTAQSWQRAVEVYEGLPSWRETFTSRGRAPGVGEVFKSEDHARTLELIAATKGEAFYRGELAEKVVAHARETGGWLSMEDLAEHEAEEVRPISVDYRGYTLHELPPNGQGLVALVALGMLRHVDVASLPVDSPQWLHMQIEAMKLAFADGRRYIADPDWMDVDTGSLLDEGYLAEGAQSIDTRRAGDPGHGEPRRGGTVYLTAADAAGNMVSYIQSNYMGFGSGIVIPGTGIALQNRGACFTTEAGHPNRIAPGKRPYHTIIPGFVTKDGRAVMSFGVMGGYMQPQGHVQVMLRMVDHGQNPQAALDAPRWRIGSGRQVMIEPGFDARVYEELRRRGHQVTIAEARTVAHGGGQVILRLADGYCAASDLRRDGEAVGY